MHQLWVDLPKGGQVIPENERSGCKSSRSLSDGVGQHFAPGESTEDGKGQGYRRIEMRPRGLARNVNSHRHAESPAQGDVGKTTVDGLARVARWKKHNHGNDSGAEQNQHKSAQE